MKNYTNLIMPSLKKKPEETEALFPSIINSKQKIFTEN
jgi:hypothetical protein